MRGDCNSECNEGGLLEQWSFTGGRDNSLAMSEFLIVAASEIWTKRKRGGGEGAKPDLDGRVDIRENGRLSEQNTTK